MVDDDQSVFPFNEYEHLICNLIERGGLTYKQYIDIRTEYISANPNLWVFEISAPRDFGEKFAQTYVQGKCSNQKFPTKNLTRITLETMIYGLMELELKLRHQGRLIATAMNRCI